MTSKAFVFSVVRYALACIGICATVLFIAAPVSCKMTEEGIEIVSSDRTAPQILSFDAKERSVLSLSCSEPMTLKDVSFVSAGAEADLGGVVSVSYDATKTCAELALSEATEIGKNYELRGVVEDTHGNTLTFSLPFVGYNDNPAKMVFSEIRYKGDTTSPKYVELYVVEDGNTAGLEIVSGSNGEAQKFVFPALAVKAGDYITVHYCKATDSFACESELTDDLTTASAKEAKLANCDTARDLWFADNTNGRNFGKSDVIVLRTTGANAVKDAVFYAEDGTDEWAKALQKELAAKAVAKGIWSSPSPVFAVDSSEMTPTKTLSRKHIASVVDGIVPTSADDWFIATKKTPGTSNDE